MSDPHAFVGVVSNFSGLFLPTYCWITRLVAPASVWRQPRGRGPDPVHPLRIRGR
jgi:hypothetical protein